MALDFNSLQKHAGIVFMGGNPQELTDTHKARLAMDSATITAGNSAIPSLFNTWIDPKAIEVVVQPMKMAEVYSETKKGDWTTRTATFPMIESTGEVSTYGDFNENAMSGINANFPSRQPYTYQTIVRVGEREMAEYGEARIDLVSRKQTAAALTLNKYQNKTYIYGVEGLENFGAINDPNLLPSITDTPWTSKTALQIYDSIRKLYIQLVSQTKGLVERTDKIKLVMSPDLDATITAANDYNVNVPELIKKSFPNLTVVTVPEYQTAAGELVQMIVEEYEGQATCDLGFTEKMRVHPMIQMKSGFEQKRSQGSFGAVIYRPLFIASMLVS